MIGIKHWKVSASIAASSYPSDPDGNYKMWTQYLQQGYSPKKNGLKVCQPPLNANLGKGICETHENNTKLSSAKLCTNMHTPSSPLGKLRLAKLLTLQCL